MKKPRETDLVRSCLDLLHRLRIPAWRQNVGAMRRGQRWVRFGERGTADILGCLPGSGRLLCIECKMPGRKPSEYQKTWLATMQEAGATVLVCEDVGQLIDVLREEGYVV